LFTLLAWTFCGKASWKEANLSASAALYLFSKANSSLQHHDVAVMLLDPSRKESENAGCTASYSMIDDDITTRYLKQNFKL